MASEQTYQKYRRLARYPLFLAGLLFLIGLALVLDPNIATAQQHHITGRALTLIDDRDDALAARLHLGLGCSRRCGSC